MHIDLGHLNLGEIFSGSHNALFHNMDGLSSASVDLKQLGLHHIELTGQDTVSHAQNLPAQSEIMQRDTSLSNLGDNSSNPFHIPGGMPLAHESTDTDQ